MGAPAGGDAGAKGVSTRPAGERVGVVVRVRPQPGADAGRQPAVRVDPDDTRRVQVLSAVDAAAIQVLTHAHQAGREVLQV